MMRTSGAVIDFRARNAGARGERPTLCRADDGVRSTIEALLDIVAAVGGRLPVLFDRGFCRGTDSHPEPGERPQRFLGRAPARDKAGRARK